MSKQTINTIKNWFRTGSKPTQAQFWDWLDSFFHKDDNIPSGQVEGLQGLLDAKMDKKDVVAPEQVGPYDPEKNYIYNPDLAEYVSFSNPESGDKQFQKEGFYRLLEDAPAGQNPETHPGHWAYQGGTIGDITIEDVIGLREELDLKLGDAPQDGKSYLRKDGAWVELPQQAAGLASAWEVDAAAIRALTEHEAEMDVGNYATGAIYEYNATATAPDDGDVYLRPDDVASGDPGRWVKQKTFALSNTFSETLIFRDIETFEFTKSQSYKITEVIEEIGVTASIKLHDTLTDYTLGDTIGAFGRLDITVDVLGAITIKGELV